MDIWIVSNHLLQRILLYTEYSCIIISHIWSVSSETAFIRRWYAFVVLTVVLHRSCANLYYHQHCTNVLVFSESQELWIDFIIFYLVLGVETKNLKHAKYVLYHWAAPSTQQVYLELLFSFYSTLTGSARSRKDKSVFVVFWWSYQ